MEIVERILEQASKMFLKHGIRSVTMDDIAREMGVSKRTIYENFRDKDELLEICLRNHKQEVKHHQQLVIATSTNVLESIYRIMFEVAAAMNQVHPSFISDLKKYHNHLYKDHILKNQDDHIHVFEKLLIKGIEDGIFRDNINVAIVTRMLNSQLREMTNEELFPVELFSRADVFVNIIVNFTRGIATPKGIKVIDKIIELRKNELEKKQKNYEKRDY